MTTKRLGRGLGIALMVLAVVGISSLPAFAAGSTCYMGCTPTTTIQTGSGGGGGSGSGGGSGGKRGTRPPVTKSSGGGSGTATASAQSTKSSGGSLPFTGADVEELTAFGVGALLVGGVLVRRSRNRRRAQA